MSEDIEVNEQKVWKGSKVYKGNKVYMGNIGTLGIRTSFIRPTHLMSLSYRLYMLKTWNKNLLAVR